VNDSTKEIKNICLHLLSRREHSKKELLQKLVSKGYKPERILTVIDELAQEGWQDDLRYSENYIRSRILKGYGPIHITHGLRQNGIDLAQANLDMIVQATAGSWMSLLEQVYSYKYGEDNQLVVNEWAKRSRFLIQRGFTVSMISLLFEHLNIILI